MNTKLKMNSICKYAMQFFTDNITMKIINANLNRIKIPISLILNCSANRKSEYLLNIVNSMIAFVKTYK